VAAVRVLRKSARLLICLLKYPFFGLAVFGRGLHVSRPPHDDEDVAVPAGARGRRMPRRFTPGLQPERASSAPLSPDERLWAAEMDAADDAGA
jgi:hypothetical protein